MKLHRDSADPEKTALFMLMRVRDVWAVEADVPYVGPVESDETYMGGKLRNMNTKRWKELTGRRAVGTTAVMGAMGRATKHVTGKVVRSTDKATLQRFASDIALEDARAYSPVQESCHKNRSQWLTFSMG